MCLIPTATLCVLSLQSLTIEGRIESQISGNFQRQYNGIPNNGPLGVFTISLEANLPKGFSIPFGIEHHSMTEVGDRGEEVAFISLRWRPFQ